MLGLIVYIRSLIFELISEETTYITDTILRSSHPIERLHLKNLEKYKEFVARQSKTPEEAVETYRERYRREPPSGFENWVRYALSQNCSVIDDYDIIEERIAPFRNVSPSELNRRMVKATDGLEVVKIRDGKFQEGGRGAFSAHLQGIVDRLPNMDLLLNKYGGPRVAGYEINPIKSEVVDLSHKVSWPWVARQCQSDSQILKQQKLRRWGGSKPTNSRVQRLSYVEDPGETLDICAHPESQNQHGFLNSPSTFKFSKSLLPVMTPASLSTLADIIIPSLDNVAGHYLGDVEDTISYADKKPQVYWRGLLTGSFLTEATWLMNHRVRFVKKFENNPIFNIGFSGNDLSNHLKQFSHKLQELVGGFKPSDPRETGYQYQYAFDLDGNGYSGQYYRLLISNSLVFKQTMFEQWHDERLVPWVHYVPISMEMKELESVIDYFTNDLKGRIYGERIAMYGKKWARTALRVNDMTAYTYRLLLEYAALFDERMSAENDRS
ncbi:hypothetical protein ABW20_dc0109950 [Dactylellina cionopaga]|nr:hypothetical protein ABW20_dc0109950 [Dactylellina cionopaga]